MQIPDITNGTPVVVLTRGLPASGKSSLARRWVTMAPEHRARVNRDDLRVELFDAEGRLSEDQEAAVTVTQRARTVAALAQCRSVVCDDTLLDPQDLSSWTEFLAPLGVAIIVVDAPTPVDECIRRDRERGATGGRQVGEAVIRMLADMFGYPTAA